MRFELLAALGFGDGVLEGGVVGPHAHFGEGGSAGEEVEDGAYNGALFVGEGDAGGGFDVGVLDVGG